MLGAGGPLPPPPAAPKHQNCSSNARLPTYRHRPQPANPAAMNPSLSFLDRKNMFESLNKAVSSQGVRNGLSKLAQNPLAQKAAVSLAKNEQVRSTAIRAATQHATGRPADPFTEKVANAAVLGMVQEFENRPVMGRPAPESWQSSSTTTSASYSAPKPAPPPKPQPAYKTLTAIDPFEYPPQIPSKEPAWNGLDEPAPLRPPPPRSADTTPTDFSSGWGAPPTRMPAPNSPNEPHAYVRYAYRAAHADELSCEPRDLVLLQKAVDDQWVQAMNTRSGQSGIVPLNFLDIRVPLAPHAASAASPTPFAEIMAAYQAPASSGGKFDVVRALYDYQSDVDGDLNFRAGDTIAVLEQCNAEWLRGQLKGRFGIFPRTFVEFVSGPDAQPTTTTPSTPTAAGGGGGAGGTVTALYDYRSEVAEDLAFAAGDLIQVVEELGSDWVRGRLHGREGLVPLTFVTRH